MKRLKTVIVMLLTIAMLLSPVQAFAVGSVQSVRMYNACCTSRNMFKNLGLQVIELANVRIEAIIEESQVMGAYTNDPDQLAGIAASMQWRTSAVSRAAQTTAALCGVVSTCDWVDVTIGCGSNAVTVPVDPLRVVLV